MELPLLVSFIQSRLQKMDFAMTFMLCELIVLIILLYYGFYGFISSHFPDAKSLFARLNIFRHRSYVLPNKVFLVRHGQSLGNVSEAAYETTPDWKIPLTKQGKQEAMRAGLSIKEQCGDTPVIVYFSPYKRTKETMKQILRAFPKRQIYLVQEEPRIREQDFGNFQNNKKMKLCKRERLSFSRFFYRFPSGESGADVYDRVSSFMESLYRLFKREHNKEFNLIIVSHGLTIRIILMRWFRWTVQEFETLVNPQNSVPIVMERKVEGNMRKFRLSPESWDSLHAYEKLSQRALNIRSPRRRRSRTLMTLQELLPSDTEAEPELKPLQTIRESHSSCYEDTESEDKQSQPEDKPITNEDIAECYETNKPVFRNQTKLSKLIRQTSQEQ